MSKNVPTAIQVSDVSKDFCLPHETVTSVKSAFVRGFRRRNGTKETQHALRGIGLDIKQGEFFGIVGRNGSGKSTLLKILAGIYQPTKGSVVTAGRVVPFIELGVGFNGELTGRENVYLNGALLGYSEKEINARYADIVDFAELKDFMDQKLKNYSSGMQVRLAFSVATRLAESDILLIDEVLAVGDVAFQRKCFQYFKHLKKLGKTVVFVTHDMNAVREYCDRAVMIEKSRIVASGSAEKVASAYSKMFAEEAMGTVSEDLADNRWGDKTVEFTTVSVVPQKVMEQKTVTVKCTIKASSTVENPVVGFSVKNATGTVLLGTNNKIKRVAINKFEAGKRYELEWQVPNVFGDGTYYVGVAVTHDDGVATYDWWDEAATFEAVRDQKTPYVVGPSIDLNVHLLRQ